MSAQRTRGRNSRTRKNTTLLFEYRNGTFFFIFDLETTGKDPKKDRVVQFSAKKYKIEDKEKSFISCLDLFINPGFMMDEKVISIHHITNEFLADKPSEDVVFESIKNFFGPRPIVLGYNIEGFDVPFMQAMYARHGEEFTPCVVIDIYNMVKDVIYGKDVPDYKQGTILALLGLDEGLTAHKADSDTEGAARLLTYCYEQYRKMPAKNVSPLKVNYAYFWDGYKKDQKGLWVDTNRGRLWFSTADKCWYSTAIDLEFVDIDDLEHTLFVKYGIDYPALSKMTQKKWKENKG
jgi:DNA polymerase III alpha subunit (gram-positive type)